MDNVTQLFKEAEQAVSEVNGLGDTLDAMLTEIALSPGKWRHACPLQGLSIIETPLGDRCKLCERDQNGNYPEGVI